MRVFEKEGATSLFYRPSNNNDTTTNSTTTDTTQRIRLGYNNTDGFYRQIMTAFIPECNDGHNTAYDARMADVNPEDLYWVTNTKEYVIDARPFRIDLQIPLGIKVVTAGIHTIFVDELENFTGDVYILDTDTGFTQDINQSVFEVNLTPGIYNDRFKLVFQPTSTAGTNDIITEAIQVYYTNNVLNINNLENLKIKSAKIFNTIGQLIKVVSKTELQQPEISVPFHVASGTYIVQIETAIGKSGFKIIAY